MELNIKRLHQKTNVSSVFFRNYFKITDHLKRTYFSITSQLKECYL